MRAYLITLEISPLTLNSAYDMLPPHCTLVHWFWLDLTPDDLTEKLKSIINPSKPLYLVSENETIYDAPTKDGSRAVVVNTIKLTPPLHDLHMKVCRLLDELGAVYSDPEYVKAGFNPHVTQQINGQLKKGDLHVSDFIYLVEASAPEYGNNRYIHTKIPLKA